MFGLLFWGLNDKEKGMTNAFSYERLTSNLCLVYLEVKLEEKACASCINNKNANKHQK